MKHKGIFFVVFILFLFLLSVLIPSGKKSTLEQKDDSWLEFDNCTSIVVSKKASADGSVMTTHSCDGGWEFQLNIVPGKSSMQGEMRPVYKGGGRGAEMRQAVTRESFEGTEAQEPTSF